MATEVAQIKLTTHSAACIGVFRFGHTRAMPRLLIFTYQFSKKLGTQRSNAHCLSIFPSRIDPCTVTSRSYKFFARWRHIWTLPYTSVWLPPCWGSEMYCGDWEKGANRIVVHQRKWLLQWNYNICKIQAHRPFHASLIGVVTGIGEQWYV